MNIVIPMAGRGERFSNSGFTVPKPIIDVNGKPMIQAAIESLGVQGNYTFIVYDYENEEFNKKIKESIHACCSNPKIIKINYTTQGPASSVLLAKEIINNNRPLLTANCDQIMKWDSKKFSNEILGNENESRDGLVVTYFSDTIKNSYVKLQDRWAVEFAEKRVISNHSLNGIHFWNQGKDFVDSSERMIRNNVRVNNEFYIAETYNEMIKENKLIDIYEIELKEHWAIGTPEDLKRYLEKNHENS